MSFEILLFDTLKSLVAGRVFPDIGPEKVVVPYITYQQVGGDSLIFLDNTSPSKENARVQVNVWAATRLDASALSRQVASALQMNAALCTTVLGQPISQYDPETKLRGAMQDFTFWTNTA